MQESPVDPATLAVPTHQARLLLRSCTTGLPVLAQHRMFVASQASPHGFLVTRYDDSNRNCQTRKPRPPISGRNFNLPPLTHRRPHCRGCLGSCCCFYSESRCSSLLRCHWLARHHPRCLGPPLQLHL